MTNEVSHVRAAFAGMGTDRSNSKFRVTIASTFGTIFEWYDFFLYITVATVITKQFFAIDNPVAANIFALLAFATGFIVRPFGAVVFGHIGDRLGRKHTFLATIVLMGGATVAIGLLPTYGTVGLLAPIALTALRMIQGLAIGGEYGGAATYIAEHAPAGKRGGMTSWLQTSATFGFALAVIVVMLTRSILPAGAFEAWGWRVPFLASIVLLAISVWIRLKLEESPSFLAMKSGGTLSRSPIAETFATRANLRTVAIALFGLVMGQAVVFVGGQLYALIFLLTTLKVDAQTANTLILLGVLAGVPSFVIAGYASDYIGRKKIILGAFLLAAVSYVPLFTALTHYVNPALERAQAQSPVVVRADASECSLQFNPVGTSRFTSSCDVAKSALVRTGTPYSNEAAPAGEVASVRVGGTVLEAAPLDRPEAARAFTTALAQELKSAGYPTSAAAESINFPMAVLVLALMSCSGGFAFGPIAAALTEMFPARIRYTTVSTTYHIGNGWFGGLLPAVAAALQAWSGSIYAGVWYPVVLAGLSFGIGLIWLPSETRDAR